MLKSTDTPVDNTVDAEPPRPIRFKLFKDARGSFGVFDDYPHADEVLAQMVQRRAEFYGRHSDYLDGHRDKFFLNMDLPNGEKLALIVKAKSSNRAADMLYPSMPSVGNLTVQEDNRQGSVLNEIVAGKKAASRCQAKYGKELIIETPVGFHISREEGHRGERWVIFEKLDSIVEAHTLDPAVLSVLRQKRYRYATELENELTRIGVYSANLETDLVMVGNPKDVGSIRFVIVDSEEWRIMTPFQ